MSVQIILQREGNCNKGLLFSNGHEAKNKEHNFCPEFKKTMNINLDTCQFTYFDIRSPRGR